MKIIVVYFLILAFIAVDVSSSTIRVRRQGFTFDDDDLQQNNKRPQGINPLQQNQVSQQNNSQHNQQQNNRQQQNDRQQQNNRQLQNNQQQQNNVLQQNNVQQNRPTSTEIPDVSSTTTAASQEYRRCLSACLSTNEYNPVCGSDRVTYQNQNKLKCANRCGANITMVRGGSCNPGKK